MKLQTPHFRAPTACDPEGSQTGFTLFYLMAEILQTKPPNWKYVSEGGATIVFSYAGPSHPDFDGTVLRLRKSTLPAEGSQKKAASVVPTQPTDGEPDDPIIEYQAMCMQKLIPLHSGGHTASSVYSETGY